MGAVTTILNALREVAPELAMSNGALETKMVDVIGTYADSEALERENSVRVIQNALANQRITTRNYYRAKAVAFQSGDLPSYDPVNFGAYYETIDASKQIIKQAYIIGTFPIFTMMVNAVGSDGHLRVLTETELAAFDTYFQAFQPLGLDINTASLPVAKITDAGLIIYVQPGVSAEAAANAITENLIAYESEFRPSNTVTLSEIENVIQRYAGVRAVGWSAPTSTETLVDGTSRVTTPVNGVFDIENGAFTFATEVTPSIIKTLL